MTLQDKKVRNKLIYKKKLKGATDFALAVEFNLHPMTIRQIVAKMKSLSVTVKEL